jgi:hypothetical protein
VAAKRTPAEQRKLDELLSRDHTLNGAILFGLDGHIVEMQARAMEVLPRRVPLAVATKISGMAREGVRESLDRIAGVLAKLRPDSGEARPRKLPRCERLGAGRGDQLLRGKEKTDNARREAIQSENAVPRATDFGLILGQERAKEAAIISAAGGHNLYCCNNSTGPPATGYLIAHVQRIARCGRFIVGRAVASSHGFPELLRALQHCNEFGSGVRLPRSIIKAQHGPSGTFHDACENVFHRH